MKKEWLAATEVSREFKKRVRDFAFDHGIKSIGALIILALTEYMDRAEKQVKEVET